MFFKNNFQRSYLVFHNWEQNFTGRELKVIEFYKLKVVQIVKHFHMHILIDLFSYMYIFPLVLSFHRNNPQHANWCCIFCNTNAYYLFA